MQKGGTLSLTVMAIFLTLLGLFVGYLLGNWFIQLVTGGNPTPEQTLQNKVVEEDMIIEDEDTEESYSESLTVQEDEQNLSVEDYVQSQLKGEVYVIQVGAFNVYDNALTLKSDLMKNGIEAVVTEGVPYKVQVEATTDRTEAEKIEKKIKSLGYDAFITH